MVSHGSGFVHVLLTSSQRLVSAKVFAVENLALIGTVADFLTARLKKNYGHNTSVTPEMVVASP